MPDPSIRPGTYRHFKGGMYEVYGVAQRVDTSEHYVVYRPLYGDYRLVLRPYEEFTGKVVREGREQQRFAYVGPSPVDTADAPGASEQRLPPAHLLSRK